MQFTNAVIFQQRRESILFCSSSVFFALSVVFFFWRIHEEFLEGRALSSNAQHEFFGVFTQDKRIGCVPEETLKPTEFQLNQEFTCWFAEVMICSCNISNLHHEHQ